MDEQLSIDDLRCKARYKGQVYDVASIHFIKQRVLLQGPKGLVSATFGSFELMPADYEPDEEPTEDQVMELGIVAYGKGLEPDDNPYNRADQPNNHDLWNLGYAKAEAAAERKGDGAVAYGMGEQIHNINEGGADDAVGEGIPTDEDDVVNEKKTE